jgi:Type I phosphodiesterase / nucleotide pyrophosphatase
VNWGDRKVNTTGNGIQKAVVFWLSGARLDAMRALPAVQSLLQRGASVELEPLVITGLQNQYYQVASGRSPASFGFFDTIVPKNYVVSEESAGRGPMPKLLPDLLRTGGWTVQYEEKPLAELVPAMQQWTQTDADPPDCLIIKCGVQGSDELASSLSEALRLAQRVVGESGLLAILSETQPAPVKRFVNVNNFLAEMGVIELDEQRGNVNWSNSLAYFVGQGQLWINLQGREAQGAVHPQEYEEVCATLVRALPTKLRDAESGAPVIERVYRKEELYAGDYLFCAPDLVLEFKPGYAPTANSTHLGFDKEMFITPATDETVFGGVHPSTVKGFLLAAAPALAANVSVAEPAPLTAAAPTLLHALGVEYVDMDSSAIHTLFSAAYLETHPIRSGIQTQELSEEDEELIINRLRDLGYV